MIGHSTRADGLAEARRRFTQPETDDRAVTTGRSVGRKAGLDEAARRFGPPRDRYADVDDYVAPGDRNDDAVAAGAAAMSIRRGGGGQPI